MAIVAEPTPSILTNDVSPMDATLVLLLVNENAVPEMSSVFVDVGMRRNDALPYVFVTAAREMTGVMRATTSVADILTSTRLAVAACVAVMMDEPAPTMVTVRPLPPPIVATAELLLVNVKLTLLSIDVGSVRSKVESPYFLSAGTVKLLNGDETTSVAVTLDPPV